jgi:diketogulonate reductase-like aldo/keto reductase
MLKQLTTIQSRFKNRITSFRMQDVPRIGLGTALAKDPAALIAAIIHAVEECGYRYIDTALVYGNESIIGEALQMILSKGTIKRSDI